ncbi:MAG: rod shape-determining protein [Flavobacteriales bacterium]
MGFFDFMTEEIAIDLGTANTLIIHNDKVVVDEPSIVAINVRTEEVIAIGTKARQMRGKAHKGIETIRPLKDGVIADFQSAEQMIRGFIKMINRKKSIFPTQLKMVICIPSGITEVEKRAVMDSAEHAGAKEVWLIHEPMAAAIGIGIDVLEPMGNMVIDIGGGTTEIAVISLGGIVTDKSIKVAGDEFTDNIKNYMKTRYNIAVGDNMAEKIKINVGSAMTELEDPPPNFPVHGRDLMNGIPKEVIVTYKEIANSLNNSIEQIESAIMNALFNTPAELSADIYNTGLYLTGGGSMLRGLDKRIALKTKLPVYVAEDPLRAVARGTGIALKNTDNYSFLIQ